jgi:glycosyltransferase involved in cell wall biosynthesis
MMLSAGADVSRTVYRMENGDVVNGRKDAALYDVTVVIPTRNESENVAPLLQRLLPLRPAAVIFVDDSDDETAELISAFADPRVTVIHRVSDARVGGLGGAVCAGFNAATTTWVAVIDGDLQHPPETLKDLHTRALLVDNPDLVIASRYATGGSYAGLSGTFRVAASKLGTVLVRFLRRTRLKNVSDPLSGCFMLRRETVDTSILRPEGFKILLEILLSSDGLVTADVPYVFANRVHGSSNANFKELIRLARTALRRR